MKRVSGKKTKSGAKQADFFTQQEIEFLKFKEGNKTSHCIFGKTRDRSALKTRYSSSFLHKWIFKEGKCAIEDKAEIQT